MRRLPADILIYERFQRMIKIMFVCHGNICRSTMAESVFTELVHQAGRSDAFVIGSAATSTEEIGNSPHYGTVAKLRQVGIPLVPHRARQVRANEYANWDLIIGMDSANMRNLRRIFEREPEAQADDCAKLIKLLSLTGSDRDVADPWYTGNFDATYEDVLAGCKALLKQL